MKKIMSLMLGFSLIAGVATMAFGQTTDTNKKASKSKPKKKKPATTDKKS